MTTDELRELARQVAEARGEWRAPFTLSEIGRAIGRRALSYSRPNKNNDNEQGYRFGDIEAVITFTGSRWGYGGAEGNDGYGVECWQQRIGKPWREACENWVNEWRPEVRRYTDDAESLVLVQELAEAFSDFDISHDDEEPRWTCRAYGEEVRDTIYARGHTIGEAVVRCWLAWKEAKR